MFATHICKRKLATVKLNLPKAKLGKICYLIENPNAEFQFFQECQNVGKMISPITEVPTVIFKKKTFVNSVDQCDLKLQRVQKNEFKILIS